MSVIDNTAGNMRRLNTSRINHEIKSEKSTTEPEQQVDERTTHDQAQLMADDLSALLATRRRTDLDKRSQKLSEQFERVLEEDSEPKVAKIIALVRAGNVSVEALLAYARSLFPDDSDLVLVLRELLKRKNLAELEELLLSDIMQRVLEQADPKHYKAGINVALKARMHGTKMAVSAKVLRETYREFLVSEQGEITQYEQWVEQYGAKKRTAVLEFIASALVYDMQAHDPSCSRDEFGTLLSNLVGLKKIKSSESNFIEMFARNDAAHKANLEEVLLLSWWFDFVQRLFNFEKTVSDVLVEKLLLFSMQEKSQLLQVLLRAVQSIDQSLFFDEEIKQILVNKLLDWSSDSYERERQTQHRQRFKNS